MVVVVVAEHSIGVQPADAVVALEDQSGDVAVGVAEAEEEAEAAVEKLVVVERL